MRIFTEFEFRDAKLPLPEPRHPEYQYLDGLRDVMENGVEKRDHNTGNPYKSRFIHQSRYDLSEGFPLLTTKKMAWKGAVHELYWFVTGQTNIRYLVQNGVPFWNDYPFKKYQQTPKSGELPTLSQDEFIAKIKEDEEFAAKWGELPGIYGEKWRKWKRRDGQTVDQLQWNIENIMRFPDRKHNILSAWDPTEQYEMAPQGKANNFPLCHILGHWNVSDDKLSFHLYQRSCDMFLGVPINIASYSLLTHVVAKITGKKPGEFIHTLGDYHVYSDHYEQVKEQLSRTPFPFPTLRISDDVKSLDTFKPEHIELDNYNSHPKLKGKMTVAGGFDEKDRAPSK